MSENRSTTTAFGWAERKPTNIGHCHFYVDELDGSYSGERRRKGDGVSWAQADGGAAASGFAILCKSMSRDSNMAMLSS